MGNKERELIKLFMRLHNEDMKPVWAKGDPTKLKDVLRAVKREISIKEYLGK